MIRSVADARASFERDVLPHVSDYQRREAEALLDAAEAEARKSTDDFVARQEQEIRTAHTDALRTLTEARDAMDDLRREASDGRMSASEYRNALAGLRAEQEAAEAQLAKLDERVEYLAGIEDDPIAFYDSTRKRIRRLRNWPW